MQAALDQLRTEGYPMQEDDLAHLSPARFEYVNPYGKYAFPINGESIFPIGIHILEARGREMGQIVLLHGVAFSAELIQRRLHLHGIPDDNRVCNKIETSCLVGLSFFLFTTNHAFIRHKEKVPECVKGFAFIEL